MDRDQATIIGAVKTPLGLFALVVLVIEFVLGGLAVKAAGRDFTILVAGLVGTLVAVVILYVILAIVRPGLFGGDTGSANKNPVDHRYDAFISAPMAGLSGEVEYQRVRSDVLDFIAMLKKESEVKTVFYAGESLPTMAEFEVADLSLEEDLDALRDSRNFIFIYPSEVVTSALVEVGAALVLQKPSVLHVKNDVTLPYLLQNAAGALHGTPVHVYPYNTFAEIKNIYKSNRDILASD
ncbi:DUF456 domain-containing protein [Mycolicibacterium moriokaense]|uniref:Uncharacterized protein n=1 Tax=Mycolicibacterium moriokaense TaxID=39691 RepID=A0A318H623_9MYCO|nr:DUF456 domain-containing protein [Mycolicibacterium moriokaense]PXW99141.1 hypothetical protein C8E89_1413 [Mycolicibacterium moriokaense]